MITLYARFSDAALAEKAIGAMLDHGADSKDMSCLLYTSDAADE